MSNGSVTDVLTLISIANSTYAEVDKNPNIAGTYGYKVPPSGKVVFQDIPNKEIILDFPKPDSPTKEEEFDNYLQGMKLLNKQKTKEIMYVPKATVVPGIIVRLIPLNIGWEGRDG